MALLFLWTLISCILFGLAHSHICPGETTDSDDEQMEQTVADSHTTDPRWRLLFGLDAARIYALYTQVREMSQPPLVNTTSQPGAGEGSNTEQDLDTIMDAVCKVVSYYELVSSVDSGSDLHAILTANVEDSCNLLQYLVSNSPQVSSSTEFASLPSSCSATDSTRLHHYCLQRQIRSERLRVLIHRTLSDSLHAYYRGRVPTARPRDWLQSTSIPAEQQSRILDII